MVTSEGVKRINEGNLGASHLKVPCTCCAKF
jgi:hypothetical protein